MPTVPPAFATKADVTDAVAELRRELKSDFAELRAEMATKSELAELRAEMATKSELAELRAEMATESELAELRAEMITRTDLLAQGIAGLHTGLADLQTSLSRQIVAAMESARDWFVKLDDKLDARTGAIDQARTAEHRALRADVDRHVADETVHRVPRRSRRR